MKKLNNSAEMAVWIGCGILFYTLGMMVLGLTNLIVHWNETANLPMFQVQQVLSLLAAMIKQFLMGILFWAGGQLLELVIKRKRVRTEKRVKFR